MEAEATFDFDAVEPASSEAVLRAQLSNKALPVIGGVAVPSVGINLPIFKGLANEALLYGAGTLSPTQKWGRQLRTSQPSRSIARAFVYAIG